METYRGALVEFHDELAGHDVTWALTGSLNLALRGLDVDPDDVDVMTDAEGASTVGSVLEERVVRPVARSRSREKRIESQFGALELGGVEVEVMGDVRHLVDGEWTAPIDVAAHREFLDVEARAIPAMSLEHELTGYRELGREGRVARIERFLERIS
ncbi:MAG: hypothetical protein QXG03_05295 [Halalkalicoccus sp.]